MNKEFRKYIHVERFGNDEVEGIEVGTVYIFPKIDGTNGSIWMDDNDEIQAASRKRQLTEDFDNQGFLNNHIKNSDIKYFSFFNKNPDLILYGEWLVPHTIKTYRKEAWKKFYVFDVYDRVNEFYLSYEQYKPLLEQYDIEYVPTLGIVKNAYYEIFVQYLEKNNYLIEDGKGSGEGIVLKNYEYKNKYGRLGFAKIVTSEFKENHYKTMGAPETEYIPVEKKIVDRYLTDSLIEKEYSKIKSEKEGWNNKLIPFLFGRVHHAFINEEMWNVLKKEKNPTINFNSLYHNLINKVKEVKAELF